MNKQLKKVKILYTIPNFDTAGSGLLLYELVTKLDSAKFEPHIACLHDRGVFFETVKDSGIPIHVFPFTCDLRNRLNLPYHLYKICNQFRKIRPDLIHSFHYNADYSEPLASRLAGVKWVYTKKNMSWKGSSYNAWKLRSRLANGIIAQNKQMTKDFFPGWGKVKHIPSWVDTERFKPEAADSVFRREFGVFDNERVLICVANLVPVKGIETLIDAFAMIAVQFPEWKLWIVGDNQNEYAKQLMQRVLKIQLQNRITFTGKVSNVKLFLDQAEIFVLPTLDEGRREGSPVALLEAMANGKLVLASSVPGINDQLEAWQNHLFIAGNTVALASKLANNMSKSILENQTIGAQFRIHVQGNFHIDEIVKEHEMFYQQLLSKK